MAFEWVPAFLVHLAKVPNVSEACRVAEVSRRSAYDHKAADPDFAAAWDDAVEQSTDDLVGECYRRARDGCERPVFYKGDECGHVREYSDTLAIFLLKAHRPAVYRERVEQQHSGDLKVVIEYADPDDHPPAPAAPPGPAGDPA